MSLRLSFGPLALVLFLTVLVGPFARDGAARLAALNAHHRTLLQAEQQVRGHDLSASGPVIHLPLLGPDGASVQPPQSVRLNPALLAIDGDVTMSRELRDGLRVPQPSADFRLTAQFAAPDWDGVLEPGFRPDWSRARLQVPVPSPRSLAGDPSAAVGGLLAVLTRTTGAHNRVVYEMPLVAMPEAEIVVSLRKTGFGPDMVLFANGWQTDITLRSDRPLERFDGPPPSTRPTGLLSRSYAWSIEGRTIHGQVEHIGRTPQKKTSNGFLGLSVRDPDYVGDAWLYTGLMDVAYRHFDRITHHMPALAAALALVLFLLRRQGYGVFVGAFLITGLALGTALLLTPRVGSDLALSTGAALGALEIFVLLRSQGVAAAVLAALSFAALWFGLAELPNWAHQSAAWAQFQRLLIFAPAAALALSAVAAVAASIVPMVRRRAASI